MKNHLRKAILVVVLVLVHGSMHAQSPQSFKYQSVARNAAGTPLATASVGVRISIHDLTATGTVLYKETHSTTTNAFGVFNISVGGGTVVSGTFSSIAWGTGAKFIEVEADLAGGTSYTSMGTAQLLSVPYALYSQNGIPGVNGLNVLNGTIDPAAVVGVNGEFYINTTSNKIFGPKAAGAWPAGVSLVGPPGSAANAWGSTGNAGTVDGTNFIGTTDNVALTFKVNNQKAGRIENNAAVFLGSAAGNSNSASTNTGIGYASLFTNTSGSDNSGLGYQSLFANTTGSENTSAGFASLRFNTTGINNSAFGATALRNNSTASDNTAVGSAALYFNNANYNTATGSYALYTNNTGAANTATGYRSLYLSTGANNTANGSNSLYTNSTGNSNSAVGSLSLYSNTTGSNNTATGYTALYYNNVGGSNTANGYQALYNNTNATGNTADGVNTLYNTTTGNYNTAVGYAALQANQTGSNNTAVGYNALLSGTAYTNSTAIGYNAQVTASNMIRLGDANVTSINGAVAFTIVSDGRFKKDVKEDVVGLPFIMKLRPVTYHFSMDQMAAILKTPDLLRDKASEAAKERVLQTGFIAQEVEAAAKEAGYDFSGVDKPENAGAYYGLRYSEFVMPLVKAVQEQQKMIEELQAKIQQLESQQSELAKLETENAKLKSDFDARLKKLETMLGAEAKK